MEAGFRIQSYFNPTRSYMQKNDINLSYIEK